MGGDDNVYLFYTELIFPGTKCGAGTAEGAGEDEAGRGGGWAQEVCGGEEVEEMEERRWRRGDGGEERRWRRGEEMEERRWRRGEEVKERRGGEGEEVEERR